MNRCLLPWRRCRRGAATSVWVRAGSSSGFESEGEAIREFGFPDRALRPLDVVADAAELEGLQLRVPDAVARGRASISWLPDAARVHQRGAFKVESIDAVLMCHGAVSQPEDSRHVGVAMEADATIDQLEVRVGDRGRSEER